MTAQPTDRTTLRAVDLRDVLVDRVTPAGRGRTWGRRLPTGWRRTGEYALLAVPILLLDGFASYGQQQWALTNVAAVAWAAWLFAAAVESAKLFLAAMAHKALIAGDAAFGRRLASYLAGALVGYFNALHWWPNETKALAYAGMSVASPWLWSVWSRAKNRDRLRAAGLVDARLPRFSVARWLFHPGRTIRVVSWAAWAGESDPARAITRHAEAHRPITTAEYVAAQKRRSDETLAALTESAIGALPSPMASVFARPAPVPLPPAEPAPAKAPAARRPPRKGTRRTASDEELLAVIRPIVAAGGGRPRVLSALDEAGLGAGGTRITNLIAAAKAAPASSTEEPR